MVKKLNVEGVDMFEKGFSGIDPEEIKNLFDNLKKLTKIGVENFFKLKKEFGEGVKSLKKEFKDLTGEDIESLFRIFTKTSLISKESYSLEEAIRWLKENKPKNADKACLFREKKMFGYTLHHLYLNENNELLIGSESPYLVVETIKLDKSLIDAFGDKDLIIFR